MTQKQMDQKIHNFKNAKRLFELQLENFLDTFMPLSNENAEEDYLRVLKLLKRNKV